MKDIAYVPMSDIAYGAPDYVSCLSVGRFVGGYSMSLCLYVPYNKINNDICSGYVSGPPVGLLVCRFKIICHQNAGR